MSPMPRMVLGLSRRISMRMPLMQQPFTLLRDWHVSSDSSHCAVLGFEAALPLAGAFKSAAGPGAGGGSPCHAARAGGHCGPSVGLLVSDRQCQPAAERPGPAGTACRSRNYSLRAAAVTVVLSTRSSPSGVRWARSALPVDAPGRQGKGKETPRAARWEQETPPPGASSAVTPAISPCHGRLRRPFASPSHSGELWVRAGCP